MKKNCWRLDQATLDASDYLEKTQQTIAIERYFDKYFRRYLKWAVESICCGGWIEMRSRGL